MASALGQKGAEITPNAAETSPSSSPEALSPQVASLGVLVLGHGSRDALSNDAFVAFVAEYAAHLRAEGAAGIVAHAYVELAQPSLDDALADLATHARRVIVVPLFLFAAGHVKNDLPLALARARRAFTHVDFAAAPPLGVHPTLAQVAFERAAQVLPSDAPARAKTSLVVVGRGSSDPDANGDFCKLVRLVGEGRGLLATEPTFVGITHPRVDATLEHVARARPDRIAVLPYFLFAGRLITKLRDQIDTFAQRYPWIKVDLAPHLGAEPRIFALLQERTRQAILGLSPLPCDTCMYRTPLAGRTEHVGGLKAMLYSVRHALTHTQAMPHEHAHPPLKKHVLVCGNNDCVDRGSLTLLDALRRLVKDAGFSREIRITKTSCMGRCGEGPTVAVYPDGIWYRGVKGEDASDLVREHLLGDHLVTRLVDNVMQ